MTMVTTCLFVDLLVLVVGVGSAAVVEGLSNILNPKTQIKQSKKPKPSLRGIIPPAF